MIVTGSKIELVESEVNTCSNLGCEINQKNKRFAKQEKFCFKCGSIVMEKKYQEKYELKPYNLLFNEPYREKFENELCWTDPMGCGEDGTFISNKISPFDRNIHGEIFDLTNVDMKAEIQWFEKTHEEVIAIFKKEFGENSVIIKWGVNNWYS